MEESMARFRGTYSVMLGSSQFIMTQDPGMIEHVLRANHRNYNKSPLQTDAVGRFLGNGLLTSNGEYWLRQRRLIQPGFHTERLKGLYEIIQNTVDNFLRRFPPGQDVDIYPLMNKLAFEIVINTLFNVNVPEQTQLELSTLISDIQNYVIKDIRQVYKRWWFRLSGQDAQHVQKAARVREIIYGMIRERKQSQQKFGDLLDMLIESRYEDGGHMTDDQLIDEITILIIAGHETTANALSWTLYLLATHPNIQEKLLHEAKGVMLAGAIQSDYINSIIKESMRLYPPAWVSDRICLADDTYNNFDIPQGTIVVFFYYGLHRDPAHWQDPASFKPDRFLKENFDKEKSKVYYPFGSGPRLCIGNNFAMAEMAIFLQRFAPLFIVRPTMKVPSVNALVTLKPNHLRLHIAHR
jgi:cytochrome P450